LRVVLECVNSVLHSPKPILRCKKCEDLLDTSRPPCLPKFKHENWPVGRYRLGSSTKDVDFVPFDINFDEVRLDPLPRDERVQCRRLDRYLLYLPRIVKVIEDTQRAGNCKHFFTAIYVKHRGAYRARYCLLVYVKIRIRERRKMTRHQIHVWFE